MKPMTPEERYWETERKQREQRGETNDWVVGIALAFGVVVFLGMIVALYGKVLLTVLALALVVATFIAFPKVWQSVLGIVGTFIIVSIIAIPLMLGVLALTTLPDEYQKIDNMTKEELEQREAIRRELNDQRERDIERWR